MGLIVCNKHGEQSIVHLCLHLYEAYRKEGNLPKEIRKLTDELGMTIYLCDICKEEHNLGHKEKLGFDDLQKIGDDLWSVCGKCINRRREE